VGKYNTAERAKSVQAGVAKPPVLKSRDSGVVEVVKRIKSLI
jgi:hypothetical protein